jgi:hypothetical protein
VIIVVQSFHPSIACLDREAACEALCCEQLIPIGLAVRVAFLQEERIVAEQFCTVCALEALRMEFLANSI